MKIQASKLFLTFICLLPLAVMVSCDSDDEEIVQSISAFVTAQTDSTGHVAVISTDMGETYMVQENSLSFDFDAAIRLVCTYTIEKNNTAKIISAFMPIQRQPAFARLLQPADLKFDPFSVISAYVGGGCLNMIVGIKVKDESSRHSLYPVVLDDEYETLSIIHDAGNDTPVYTKNAFLSIPLTNLGYRKNDTVRFSYHGYEADHTLKFVYR